MPISSPSLGQNLVSLFFHCQTKTSPDPLGAVGTSKGLRIT